MDTFSVRAIGWIDDLRIHNDGTYLFISAPFLMVYDEIARFISEVMALESHRRTNGKLRQTQTPDRKR